MRDEVDEPGGQHARVQLVELHQLDEVVEARLTAVQREEARDRRLARVLHLERGETGQQRSARPTAPAGSRREVRHVRPLGGHGRRYCV